MISVEDISVEFGGVTLFSGASFVVNDRDRIALTGRNGAGKTTLLRILCREQEPTSGKISASSGFTTGYLPQSIMAQSGGTIKEEAMKGFAEVGAKAERLQHLEEQLRVRNDLDSSSYTALAEKFSVEIDNHYATDNEKLEGEMERTLIGLGFERSDFDRPVTELSGGWRMRVELARLLLAKPDLLLLDEPTNHLDIESIRWLERFLCQYGKAVIIVSHDRAFINKVSNRTLDIFGGSINDYRVGFDEYVKLRAQRQLQLEKTRNNQLKEMEAINTFIERFRYKPSKASQVQSRIKQLAKMKLVELDAKVSPTMHLKFPPCPRSGDFPIVCEDLSKSYGDNNVLNSISLAIRRGEKVAFVGRNGEGKTTLVKCIMGETDFEGTLKQGHNVQIGYFAQDQASRLDNTITIRETIDNAATGAIRMKINDILGSFMFGGEIADKKVSVLSGGERSRLAMIKLLLEPVNLLILDEPTNHLDMQSKDVLKEAIAAFDGTAVIVSHDRYFLDGIVSKIYVFHDGKVTEHMGDVHDYLYGNGEASLSNLHKSSTMGDKAEEKAEENSSMNKYEERRQVQKKMKRAQKAVDESEKKITDLEERLAKLDSLLCLTENASNMVLINEYTSVSEELNQEEQRWMSLSVEMEIFSAEMERLSVEQA